MEDITAVTLLRGVITEVSPKGEYVKIELIPSGEEVDSYVTSYSPIVYRDGKLIFRSSEKPVPKLTIGENVVCQLKEHHDVPQRRVRKFCRMSEYVDALRKRSIDVVNKEKGG